ncbi:MAG: methylenetetrahydrofolate--tRNA-(uracil(54)-C(5))-methyltransferase (FADH(2)-oxidizing) TrmFO [Oligoflexia bacterium]|nr:methylenetetrahydrofolate--tRNA-(uracil(54)-C(5))-methyltransferase (FADH(2)-oxidizing) TrmFO [Oligoflexia bacterium]
MSDVAIIGGGLAGSELAFQLAEKGVSVTLYEQRLSENAVTGSGAHKSRLLAELVCSNSLRSNKMHSAAGLLKAELRLLGSLLIAKADRFSVPAGSALAVSREDFSGNITDILFRHGNIDIVAEKVEDIGRLLSAHQYVVVASGPLTSGALSGNLKRIMGNDFLYFYDAIAPIIESDSINMNVCFRCDRYNVGSEAGDYINVPLNMEQYYNFVGELKRGKMVPVHDGDSNIFFRGCLPVEVMAADSDKTLLFGPMRGDGLIDPGTGKKPFAAIQLRQDNLSASMYNMVGFQTRLTYPEQKRIFRTLPGLENAEFYRMGSMHRNTYVTAPAVFAEDMSLKADRSVFIAGQLSGVEGYVESIAHAMIVARKLLFRMDLVSDGKFPEVSAIGALEKYLLHSEPALFQPMKINFGILPSLTDDSKKKFLKGKSRFEQRLACSRRSVASFDIQPSF